MRLRILLVVGAMSLVGCGIGQLMVRAVARTPAALTGLVVYGDQEMVRVDRQIKNGERDFVPTQSKAYARWDVTELPVKPVHGPFKGVGIMEVNPDLNRPIPGYFRIQVVVENPETNEVLDLHDYGLLVADPAKAYRREIKEQFDLPRGIYVITFRGAIAREDGSMIDPKVHSFCHSQRVTVY